MSVPGIPLIEYRAVASNQALEFWWGPPITGNYSSITSYILQCSSINNSQALSTIIYNYGPSTFYEKVTNLTNRSEYEFQLAANNAYGNGPYAAFRLAQPGLTSSGPSTIFVSSMNGNASSVTVSWSFSEGPDESQNDYFVLSVVPSTSSATISSFTLGLYPDQRTTDVRIFPSTNYYTFIIQSVSDADYSYPSMSSLYEIYLGPDRNFFPTRISSLSLWLDLTSLSTITLVPGTSTVGAWSDKSPAGNNYIYAGTNPAAAPDLVYDTEFSTNALSFGRNPTGLTPSNVNIRPFSTNTNFTIFTVHQIEFGPLYNFSPSTSNISLNYNNSFSTLRASYSSNTISSINNNGDVLKGIGCYIVNTNNLVSSNITMSYFNNGYLMSGNNPITNLNPINISSSHIRIGYEHINIQGNPDGYYRGKLFEYLVYNVGFDINDRQIMEGYLAWKYKIPSKLPPSHPYRNFSLSTIAAVPSVQPSTIGYLTVSNISATEFTLNWTGGDNANTFIYYLNGVATVPTVDNAITSKSVTFSGLTSGTTYTISINVATDRGAIFSKFNPANVGTGGSSYLKHWYDSADPLATGTALSTGTRITTWFDKSGNANNAIINGVTGTADIQYDYNNSAIALENVFYNVSPMSWMVNNYWTIFIVGYTRNIAGNNETYYGGTTINEISLYGNNAGKIVGRASNGLLTFDTAQSAGQTSLITFVNSYNLGLQLHIQGVTGINVGATIAQFNPVTFFGKGFNTTTNIFTGGIREMLFYNGALLSTQRQLVEGYLIWKYNMQTLNPTVYDAQNLFPLTSNITDIGTGIRLSAITNDSNNSFATYLGRVGLKSSLDNAALVYSFDNYKNKSFTVSYWLACENGYNRTNVFIGAAAVLDGSSKFFETYQSSNALGIVFQNPSGGQYLNTTWVPNPAGPGPWRFFTITFNATTRGFQFYGNGQLVGSGTVGYAGTLLNANYIVLTGGNTNYFYNLAINDRVLTPTEIADLFRPAVIANNHPYVTTPPPVNTASVDLSLAPTSATSYPGGSIIIWANKLSVPVITYNINGSIVTPVRDDGIAAGFAYFGGLASGIYPVNINFVGGALSNIISPIINITTPTNYNPTNTFYLFSNTTDVGSNPVTASTVTNITYNTVGNRPAIYFVDSTSQVLYPFNYSAGSFTLSFWLFSATGNSAQIFGLTQTASIGGNKFFAVDQRSGSNMIQWFFTGGNLTFEWTRGIEQWNFYTMTYNNTNNQVQFYGNGSLLHTGTGIGTIQFATNLNIGNSSNRFYMRQLSVYNSVLLSGQINTLYTTDFVIPDVSTVYNANILFRLKSNHSNTGTDSLIYPIVPTRNTSNSFSTYVGRLSLFSSLQGKTLTYPFSTHNNYANSSFTISFWLLSEQGNNRDTLCISAAETSGPLFFELRQLGELVYIGFSRPSGGRYAEYGWLQQRPGFWRFYTITFNAITRVVEFYGNGQIFISFTRDYTGAFQNAAFLTLDGGDSNHYYNLAIHNRVLTATEIATLSFQPAS